MIEIKVTKDYYVDIEENVYDDEGMFFCKWQYLTEEEQRLVLSNPRSKKSSVFCR